MLFKFALRIFLKVINGPGTCTISRGQNLKEACKVYKSSLYLRVIYQQEYQSTELVFSQVKTGCNWAFSLNMGP